MLTVTSGLPMRQAELAFMHAWMVRRSPSRPELFATGVLGTAGSNTHGASFWDWPCSVARFC